jgi:hypothetical protein
LIAVIARALLIETVSQARHLVVRRERFGLQTPMADTLPSDADLVSRVLPSAKANFRAPTACPHVTQREKPDQAIART